MAITSGIHQSTGLDSWTAGSNIDLGQVYADESLYEQDVYNPGVSSSGIAREAGEQIVQAAPGMSSGGAVTQYAEKAEADRDPNIKSTQLDIERPTEVLPGTYTQQEQEEQLGGTQFDWREYRPSGEDTQRGVGDVIPDYDPLTGFSLPEISTFTPEKKTTTTEIPVPTATPVLTGSEKDMQDFLTKYTEMGIGKTHGGGSWLTKEWVTNNWAEIKGIQDIIASKPYGAGFQMKDVLPLIEQAKTVNQGTLPQSWSSAWKGLDDTTRKQLGPNQKKIMDFWTKTDPVKGFYGKTFRNQKVDIAGHKDIQATSWQGVIDYFTNLQGTDREVPMSLVLHELNSKGQNFPRTIDQGNELGEMVGKGLAVVPKDPLDPKAPQARNIGDSLNRPLELIWQRFSAGIIKPPDALNTQLLDAFARAMFPDGWEDKAMTWQRMQEGMAEGEGTWGGATQDQMDQAELWAIGVIKQMVADKAANFEGTYVPKSPPPPEVVDPTVTGRDFPMPKNADEALAILNTLSREDDNFDMVYEMYNMYARQGGGGGAGTGTEQDLQNQLTTATMTINALRQSAELTAQQHGLLNDWEREMQGESQRLRGIEAERLGTQQGLERDRMTAETGGFIGDKETYESRLFTQRGDQEAQREKDVAAASQTAAEAEASRLAITEGGVASQEMQAQAAKDQVAHTYEIAKATLTGKLGADETLEHKQLGYVQALKEAELSGTLWEQMGTDKDLPGYAGVKTMAMRTFALNESIAKDKMALERQIQLAASRREDSRLSSEHMRMQNQTFIERGQLAEAVQSRREMNRIKEVEMEDARNTMRLNTLMSLMNPVAMLMAQRMGMIPQLEAAMGIDLDIPEIPSMLPDGMNVPTAQMLNLFSPQDQQLIMAESSFRTGLSQEDVSSVIHRQRPGAPGGQMLSYGGGR